jgi:YfiH family protein
METITDKNLTSAGFYWREKDGVRALICEPLEADGFVNGFSTRLGGVSPMPYDALSLAGFNEDTAENILENRRRFLKLFPGDWALAGCWQVHSADVRTVNDVSQAKPAEDRHGDTIYCDAIVSQSSHVLAGIKTADCVPLLIGDQVTRAFAAVHAGWRGTLSEIAAVAVKRLSENYDAKPADLRVAIGASAGPCCYEVGNEVIDVFTEKFSYGSTLFTPTREGHALVDLLRANRQQLMEAGVVADRIHIAPFCTMCRTDLFFSYRREKNVNGRVGRLMAVVGRCD